MGRGGFSEDTLIGPTNLSDAVTAMDEASRETAAWSFARGETAGMRAFVWRPLRSAWRAPWRPAERWRGPVFAAYRDVLHAAKLMESELHWRETTAVACTIGRRRCVVRRGWRDAVTAMLEDETEHVPIAGGRGAARRCVTEHGNVILRQYRRGGAIRWLGTLYVGRRWRPFQEFWLLHRARRCGLPVVEPVAAVVEPLTPWLYRGWLATVEVMGATPLSLAVERTGGAAWVEPLAASLRVIHDGGLRHADLNLGNVLVTADGGLVYVDLDRGAIEGPPVSPSARRAGLARVRRSARRHDPDGRVFTDADLDRLEQAYWRSDDA